MKLLCKTQVVNRTDTRNKISRHVKSTVALCKDHKKDKFYIILFSGQSKTGTKYPLNGNIKNVATKFVDDGMCTIQFSVPEHNICIQANAIQLKVFLHQLKLALSNKLTDKQLANMSVSSVNDKVSPVVTKLIITQRSQYPTKGFPRTLEVLQINDIRKCGFDMGILHLTRLKVLDLSSNLIEYLPEGLGNLPNLKELNLSHNCLGKTNSRQWKWLGNALVNSLLLLDISYNELSYLPSCITKLNKLTTLMISHNNLQYLPTGIGNLSNLRELVASNNCLKNLPGTVERLKLKLIDLSGNTFEQKPPNENSPVVIKAQLFSLKEAAAKRVIYCKVPYSSDTLPYTLIQYLDTAQYCICGRPCFSMFIRYSHNLLLTQISETVTSTADSSYYVPIDYCICSTRCFNRVCSSRNRVPIVR